MSVSPDRGVLGSTGPAPSRTVAYGPDPHQVYEVHEPAGDPRAWVVLVHGGFWRAAWDRVHLRALAASLTGQGYAVALVEYVRSGMPGGGWPGTGADVVRAVTAVGRVEAGRCPVVLVGHSAGGHLAVWALHQVGDGPSTLVPGLVGAVSLAGCLDLHLVHRLDLDDDAAADLMGSTPASDPAAWEAADPARLGRAPYPVVVVHGDQDEKVPVAVARSWWERAGDPARDRLALLPGVTHFALIDPTHPARTTMLDALEALLAPR